MHRNVIGYLNRIVGICPEKTAYSDGISHLSFRDVYLLSRGIGSYLYRRGIYKKPVVVFMKKSPQEITAFLGVVTGGDFYVPVDEEMPAGRIRLILDNVKSPLIICDESTLDRAKQFAVQDCEIVLYDEMIRTPCEEEALEAIFARSIDTDPIYIVFTSGSTGIPKGVAACHRSVMDYVEQLSEVMGFGQDTVFGNQAPLYFDACLKEIYPTLMFGATTYLIPKACFSFPVKLVEYLNEQKINTICWVVSALTMVSTFGTFDIVKPEYLHTIGFGSEVFPVRQFRIWRKALPEALFVNLYGPTECTGMCCYYKVEREFAEDEVIPVGRPFPNREILLLSETGEPVKEGEQGEICVRGTALTLGYYNDRERTEAVFIQNPLNHSYPELLYKTGDMGRYDAEGNLCFMSRRDYQVKHMGHRIELGEIEANVYTVEGVRMASCGYDEKRGKIVLFYVGDISEKELAGEMKSRLPRYMIPNRTVRLETMPLTANGKIDRVALKTN